MDIRNSLIQLKLNPIKLDLTFEEYCDRFLSTRKGLKYLLLRYRNLSLLNAIKEYKLKEAEAEFYCP